MKRFIYVLGALIAFEGCFVVTDFDVAEIPATSGSGGSGEGEGEGEGGGIAGTPCTNASECPTIATDSECQRTTCQQNRCIVSRAAEGQLLPVQTLGDCASLVCGAMGTIDSVADEMDVQDDANDCTMDRCDGVTPAHEPVMDGDPCGATGSLVCASGVCSGCSTDAECGVNSDCVTHSCNLMAGACETETIPEGGICEDDGVFCNGVERCQNNSCVPDNVNPCPDVGDGDADCREACNEAMADCSASDPEDTACDDGMYCNGAEICDGGDCKTFTAPPCTDEGDGDLDCTEACDEDQNDCSAPDTICDPCSDGVSVTGNCVAGVCNAVAMCPL